jgi:thymidylate synthase
MNSAEQQYLDIISEILDSGEWKDPARAGMPRTKEVFFRTMTFDLSEGYPCFTSKKMAWKTCLTELTWFLKGDTNIKYLIENGCNIWTDDAYKFYVRNGGDLNKDAWKEKVIAGDWWKAPVCCKITGIQIEQGHKYGWLGYVYGHQWRSSGCLGFDQVAHVINDLKNNPNGRYKIICAWSPEDYLSENSSKLVALPACHVYYQFCVNNGKLDMMMVQRSCDMFLGVPFDIASGAALLTLIAHHTGYEPGVFHWVGNCCHLYENHIEQAKELITREPYAFPKLEVNWRDNISDYVRTDFNLIDYQSHDRIVAPLSVGV